MRGEGEGGWWEGDQPPRGESSVHVHPGVNMYMYVPECVHVRTLRSLEFWRASAFAFMVRASLFFCKPAASPPTRASPATCLNTSRSSIITSTPVKQRTDAARVVRPSSSAVSPE